jgi:hypothetical protein
MKNMLFPSKGEDAPIFSYFHLGSLKNFVLLLPVPPSDIKSLQHFIIISPMVLELQEEKT